MFREQQISVATTENKILVKYFGWRKLEGVKGTRGDEGFYYSITLSYPL